MTVENKNNIKLIPAKFLNKSGDKSIVVLIERIVKHKKYKKYITLSKKIMVHNETNENIETGKTVYIKKIRPKSKTKFYSLHSSNKEIAK